MALSTGQINDAFQQALGRPPTGAEIAAYSQDNSLEGSPGQQTLIQRLNPSAGSSGGFNIGGKFSPTIDPIAAAKQAQQLQIEANQPAISTLQGQKSDLAGRYQDLLDSITAAEEPAVNSATVATSSELAKRGITNDSTLGQQELAKNLLPVTTTFGQLKSQTGLAETQDLNTLAANIASLQAGNVPGALSFGNNLANAAAQIAAAASYGVSGGIREVPAGGSLVDTTNNNSTVTPGGGNLSLNTGSSGLTSPGSNLPPLSSFVTSPSSTPSSSKVSSSPSVMSLPLSFGGGGSAPSASLR